MVTKRVFFIVGLALGTLPGCGATNPGTEEMVEVLVAKNDLDKGKVLTTEDVTIEKLPKRWLPEEMVSVAVAQQDLERGKEISAEDTVLKVFRKRLIPANLMENVVFARDRVAVEGLWWGRNVKKGEMIYFRDVTGRRPDTPAKTKPD